jgi:hypothetical protein
VRGAYAECQLEVPLGRLDVGVVVRPESGCQLGANDSVVAWLRPYTALHSCPSGQFLDTEGLCSNYHDIEEVLGRSCLPGQRLSGWRHTMQMRPQSNRLESPCSTTVSTRALS